MINKKEEFENIIEGLKINDGNYECYKRLGDFYKDSNIDLSYLCYEHANFYCMDSDEKNELLCMMEECRNDNKFSVVPASIIILSYNLKDIMVECLEAIRNTTNSESYEIVVVDSSTEEDIKDYLRKQEDINLIMNSSFGGFAAGCNQGAKYANLENDIFLLNNDAILAPHALFYLRMGLYSSEIVGACGPMGDNVIVEQKLGTTLELWKETAKSISYPMKNALQKAHFLQGYALLIKRSVWDVLGGLDTRFGFGCFEDTDYGMRLSVNGYYNMICHNSFVWHYGSQSMNSKHDEYVKKYNYNQYVFNTKWGIQWFNLWRTNYTSCNLISRDTDDGMNILSIGCGLANELNILNYRYPNAKTYGMDARSNVVNIAKGYQNVILGDIENVDLNFEDGYFDYILMTGVIEYLKNPLQVLSKINPKIKQGGILIVDAENALNIGRISRLMEGRTDYPDGIIRYYTGDDLTIMLKNAGFTPERWAFDFSSIEDVTSNSKMDKLFTALKDIYEDKDSSEYLKSLITVAAKKL